MPPPPPITTAPLVNSVIVAVNGVNMEKGEAEGEIAPRRNLAPVSHAEIIVSRIFLFLQEAQTTLFAPLELRWLIYFRSELALSRKRRERTAIRNKSSSRGGIIIRPAGGGRFSEPLLSAETRVAFATIRETRLSLLERRSSCVRTFQKIANCVMTCNDAWESPLRSGSPL